MDKGLLRTTQDRIICLLDEFLGCAVQSIIPTSRASSASKVLSISYNPARLKRIRIGVAGFSAYPAFAKKLGLPPDMTAGAFAAALDLISDEEGVRRLAGSPQSPDAPEEALIPPRTADPNRGEVH